MAEEQGRKSDGLGMDGIKGPPRLLQIESKVCCPTSRLL